MNGDKVEEQGGFWQRLQESPRTVSALIIILIVAAAIYAFSGDENEQVENDQARIAAEAVTDAEVEAESSEATDEAGTIEMTEGRVAADETVVADEGTEAEVKEAERTDEGFMEVAEAGDGYTHLARRASTRWLSESQVSFAVTDEHRIYIEDYIQNQLGTTRLEMGQEQLVSFALIQEAVDAAGNLSEAQLQNLTQYTSALE